MLFRPATAVSRDPGRHINLALSIVIVAVVVVVVFVVVVVVVVVVGFFRCCHLPDAVQRSQRNSIAVAPAPGRAGCSPSGLSPRCAEI